MCQCPLNQQVVNEVWSAEWLEKTLTSFNVPADLAESIYQLSKNQYKNIVNHLLQKNLN
jgi:hypothetical protein